MLHNENKEFWSKTTTMYHANESKNTVKSFFRYLRPNFDDEMTFRDHFHYLVKKFIRFSGLVYNMRHIYPSRCLLLFLKSYAESVIMYGLLVYGSAAKTNLEEIEKAL